MQYLFINGRFPQYSQTFVHDQIKAVQLQGEGVVSVFSRSRTQFRFEDSAPECAERMLYARPFNLRMVARVILGATRHPARAAQLIKLRLQRKIWFQTMLLGIQLPSTPNIAITHFGNNFPIGVQLRKYVFPKLRNVVVFHGHDISSYVKANGWANYKAAAPYISCAICVNRIWADLLKRNTDIPEIKTVYLGTDTTHRPRSRNGDNSAFSILFVGRFVEKKGFRFLFAAVERVMATSGKKIRVHCVGDGPQLADFEQRSRWEGEPGTFIFYGAQQRSFVLQLMSECDLLVAPSHTSEDGDCEGLPVVLMEAMAAGIPVVSTNHSGIPELAIDKLTGLVVQEANREELEQAILFAIDNPEKMEEIASNARKHVVLHHDDTAQAKAFIDAIQSS